VVEIMISTERNGVNNMANLKKGMKFKVKETKNPLIKTKVGNIVEIVTINEKSSEFMDTETFDWFIIDNENIEEYFENI